jgi:hypothetical protein
MLSDREHALQEDSSADFSNPAIKCLSNNLYADDCINVFPGEARRNITFSGGYLQIFFPRGNDFMSPADPFLDWPFR